MPDTDPIDEDGGELAPAAPCPTCRREPRVTAARFGQVVRCRGCGTRFRAAPAPPPPPPTPTEGGLTAEPAVEPRPRRPGQPGQPGLRRRHAADENPYDDGYGRFDEEHTPGRTIALATMHFIYCGLLLVCGVLSSVFVQVLPKALPGPTVTGNTRPCLHVIYVAMVLAAVPLLVAGLMVLRKRPTARTWTVVGLIAAGVLLAVNLVQVATTLPAFTGTPGETWDVMWATLYHLVFWLGYLIPVGVLLRPGTTLGADEPQD